MEYSSEDIEYIEKAVKRLVEVIKESGFVDLGFSFYTKLEREYAIEQFVDEIVR